MESVHTWQSFSRFPVQLVLGMHHSAVRSRSHSSHSPLITNEQKTLRTFLKRIV
jgi:hypothetical protein